MFLEAEYRTGQYQSKRAHYKGLHTSWKEYEEFFFFFEYEEFCKVGGDTLN